MSAAIRFAPVDAFRGLAIAGVVLFHFVWDLEFAGFVSGLASHPVWLTFGRGLAGSFMLLVGISLALSARERILWHPFLWRMARVLAAAALITLATFYVFPGTFIYFGILHAIAVATLIATAMMRAPIWLSTLAGIIFLAAPSIWSSDLFDIRWLAWIGFAQAVPPSNDFVPVFPWVGVTLFGMAGTKAALRSPSFAALTQRIPRWAGDARLVWLGRHSLSIYLLHQPVMLALIVPLSWLLLE